MQSRDCLKFHVSNEFCDSLAQLDMLSLLKSDVDLLTSPLYDDEDGSLVMNDFTVPFDEADDQANYWELVPLEHIASNVLHLTDTCYATSLPFFASDVFKPVLYGAKRTHRRAAYSKLQQYLPKLSSCLSNHLQRNTIKISRIYCIYVEFWHFGCILLK